MYERKNQKLLNFIEKGFFVLAVIFMFASLNYRNVPGTLKQKLILSILFDFSFLMVSLLAYIRNRKKMNLFDTFFFLFLMILNISTLFKRNLI